MNGSNFLQASQRVKYNHTSLEEMGEGRGGECCWNFEKLKNNYFFWWYVSNNPMPRLQNTGQYLILYRRATFFGSFVSTTKPKEPNAPWNLQTLKLLRLFLSSTAAQNKLFLIFPSKVVQYYAFSQNREKKWELSNLLLSNVQQNKVVAHWSPFSYQETITVTITCITYNDECLWIHFLALAVQQRWSTLVFCTFRGLVFKLYRTKKKNLIAYCMMRDRNDTSYPLILLLLLQS